MFNRRFGKWMWTAVGQFPGGSTSLTQQEECLKVETRGGKSMWWIDVLWNSPGLGPYINIINMNSKSWERNRLFPEASALLTNLFVKLVPETHPSAFCQPASKWVQLKSSSITTKLFAGCWACSDRAARKKQLKEVNKRKQNISISWSTSRVIRPWPNAWGLRHVARRRCRRPARGIREQGCQLARW